MARISGVDLPRKKRMVVAMTYLYGVGTAVAKRVLAEARIDENLLSDQLTEGDVARIREILDGSYRVEGDLRREISLNIKRLVDMGCYRGTRHRRRLPVRGQRTHSNARTRKGRAIAIAGKKSVKAMK